jgi:hypothetical protein
MADRQNRYLEIVMNMWPLDAFSQLIYVAKLELLTCYLVQSVVMFVRG